MLFSLFRTIFFATTAIICFLLIKKSKINNKSRWTFVSCIILLIITNILYYIPIENAFITFSSPQAAYNYASTDDIKLIVNGENSDYVIGLNKDGTMQIIIPKTEKGWKVGLGFDGKHTANIVSEDVIAHVYRYKKSSDFYIMVYTVDQRELEISDNRNSDFQSLAIPNNKLNKTDYTYYAYIKDFNSDYELTVNGSTVSFTK